MCMVAAYLFIAISLTSCQVESHCDKRIRPSEEFCLLEADVQKIQRGTSSDDMCVKKLVYVTSLSRLVVR